MVLERPVVPLYRFSKTLADRVRHLGFPQIGYQEAELVAAETRVKIVEPRLLTQQLSDAPVDEVAHRAAVRVVDELEARNADHADCAPSAPLLEGQEQPALLGESGK